MNNNNDYAAGFSLRRADRGERRGHWTRDLAVALAVALGLGLAGMAVSARADESRLVQISGKARTAMITVTLGKSQDVHTDRSFVDVTVGDPEVADVNPLTDHSLSILAKKIGTTRVSVYAEDKKLVGIFDVEVNYDLTQLSNELQRRFPGSAIKASSVNGRIMLSGEVADAATLDKAVTIARQFGPEVINSVSVMQPQQVMLEVRFIELSRTAGRELGVQWNRFGGSSITNIGDNRSASQLPVTAGDGSLSAAATAAGVISGASPFGFMISRIVAGGVGPKPQVIINRFHQKIFSSALALKDVQHALGDSFASAIPNDYNLVREAIDRGVPLEDVKQGNKITAQLRRLVLESSAAKGEMKPLLQKLKLAVAG